MLCAKYRDPNGTLNRHALFLFLPYRPLGKTDINQVITICQHGITTCGKVCERKQKGTIQEKPAHRDLWPDLITGHWG